jgi:hypothetical protein
MRRAIALGLTLLALVSCGVAPKPNQAAEGLKKIDAALDAGDLEAGRRLLSAAERANGGSFGPGLFSAPRPSDWLSFLKRERRLAQASGDYKRMVKVALRARKLIPASSDIHTALAYALIKSQKPEEALRQLPSREECPADSTVGRLRALALVSERGAAAPAPGERGLAPADWDFLAEASGLPRFHLNAAILYLQSLDRQRAAQSLAGTRRGLSIPIELYYGAGLNAVGVGEYVNLNGLSLDQRLVLADCLYSSGQEAAAYAEWKSVSEERPGQSPVAWMSAAALLPNDKREATLLHAQDLFPHDDRVKLALGSLYAQTGREEATRSILTKVRSLETERIILSVESQARGTAAERLEALYLNAANSYPHDDSLQRYCFQGLARLGRFDAARAVAKLALRGPHTADWRAEAEAYLAAYRGDPEAALKRLNSMEAPARFDLSWNKVILIKQSAGKSTYEAALKQLLPQAPDASARAKVLVALADIRQGAKENRAAADLYRAALEAQPGNLEALRGLKLVTGKK